MWHVSYLCLIIAIYVNVVTWKIVTLSSLQGIFIFFTFQFISHNVILFLIIVTSYLKMTRFRIVT